MGQVEGSVYMGLGEVLMEEWLSGQSKRRAQFPSGTDSDNNSGCAT
jgi:hypothetical protein